jgi:hypothetical protein
MYVRAQNNVSTKWSPKVVLRLRQNKYINIRGNRILNKDLLLLACTILFPQADTNLWKIKNAPVDARNICKIKMQK